MFASATCQRSCLTEEIDDAAPTSAAQERKIIMRCKSFVDVCNNIFRATWRSFMMRRLKTRRAPQRSHEIPSITGGHRTLSAANKNNPICANAAEFKSPSVDRPRSSIRLLAEEGASSASSEFSRELSLLDARRSARERRGQQTEKQRRATGWNTSRTADTPRKTSWRSVSEDSFRPNSRPIDGTTGGRESRKAIRLVVAIGIIKFSRQFPSRFLSNGTPRTNDKVVA